MGMYSEAYETTYPEELDKKTSLANKGKFYSLVDQVFGEANERVEFAGGLNAIRRTKANRNYRVVLNEIGLAKTHYNRSRKSSVLTSDKLRSKQNPLEEGGKLDILGTTGGEDAHAVPDSEMCAPSYCPFLQCVIGLNLDLPAITDEKGDPLYTPLSLEKLRAASQDIDSIDASAPRIIQGSDDEEFLWRKKIMKHIANDNKYAIKNLLINKTRLPSGHKVPYDTHPGFFVLPCIPPNEAKDWTPGKEYEEVVLICKGEKVARHMIGGRGFNAREEGRVAAEAQPRYLDCARDLLTATIKTLAESATREGCVHPLDLINSENAQQEMARVLADLADGNVRVPGRHVTAVNVLKVRLQNSLDYEVPDPMLLAMKAAVINWYYMMTGLKLLPAWKTPEDPLKEEIRRANEELCEELREHDLRPETWDDLGKGLGQSSTPDNRPARVSLSPTGTPDNQPDIVSLSPTGSQEITEEYDLNLTSEELSSCELFALYDEIGDESDQD